MMDKDTYLKELETLAKEYEDKKDILHKKYAMENNSVKPGDKFTDSIGTILVEKIGIYLEYATRTPSCRYFGVELKKDGTPKKSGEKRWAYQSNEVKNDNSNQKV